MIRRALEWVGGSVIVYVLVTACAGAGGLGSKDDEGPNGDGDGDGVAGNGDSEPGDGDLTGNDDGSGDGGIFNPVPDASAAEDGTRIVNVYRTTTDGLRTPQGFYDTQHQLECRFEVASDGKVRCLPSGLVGTIATLFSDSSCTQAAIYVTKGSCRPIQGAKTIVDEQSCGHTVERYAVGDPVTGVYSGTPANCTLLPTGLDIWDVYEVGDLIDPTIYAEGFTSHD